MIQRNERSVPQTCTCFQKGNREQWDSLSKEEWKNRNIDIDTGYFIGLYQITFGLRIAEKRENKKKLSFGFRLANRP